MAEPLRQSEVEPPEEQERSLSSETIEAERELTRVKLSRCRLAGDHPKLMLRDLTAEACDARNTSLVDVVGTRLVLRDCQLLGVDVSGGVLRDALLVGCQLRMARAFGASFERCWFEGCDLREAEFEESQFDRVAFRDCNLAGARCHHRRLHLHCLGSVDFRGSRVEGLAVSSDRLAGAVISGEQADVFAAAFGLRVLPINPEEA